MKLNQALAVSNLGVRPRSKPLQKNSTSRTAAQIAERIFALAEESGRSKLQTPAAWQKVWLASEKFYLVDLPLHLAAVPQRPVDQSRVLESMRASADSVEPIVVDVNKQKLGISAAAFYPPVIVVDGKYRHAGFRMQGRDKIKAWVGELAAEAIGLIQADHQFGASELKQKISEELSKQYPADPEKPFTSRPYIEEVYPLENYFVYQKDGKKYRQSYKCSIKKRTVSLQNDPKEVTQKYVDLEAAADHRVQRMSGATPLERSMRIFASAGAGMGGPGSSLGSGSGPGPTMAMKPVPSPGSPSPVTKMPAMKSKKAKKMEAQFPHAGGYNGYKSASPTQSNRTKGASGSEMAPKLKGSGYDGYGDASAEEQQRKKAPKGSEMEDAKTRTKQFNSIDDVGGLKGAADILADASRVGKIWNDCQKAMRSGWKPKMSAKAPPGWEGTVKKMKDHPGITNPWALAWHMKEKGYHPGGSDKKK